MTRTRGEDMGEVDRFEYLGSVLQEDDGFEEDTKNTEPSVDGRRNTSTFCDHFHWRHSEKCLI